ncbi:MAG: hypothetical protein ACK5O7_05880 [Holosporales bacterium]
MVTIFLYVLSAALSPARSTSSNEGEKELYGGREGHQRFLLKSQRIQSSLANRLRVLREDVSLHSPQTFRTIIMKLARKRYKLAQAAAKGMEAEEGVSDFLILRAEDPELDYTITPLYLAQYDVIRDHFHQVIHHHLSQKKSADAKTPLDAWFPLSADCRYQVQFLRPEEWPILLLKEELERYTQLLTTQESLTSEDLQLARRVLESQYMAELLGDGGICRCGNHYFTYQRAVVNLVQQVFATKIEDLKQKGMPLSGLSSINLFCCHRPELYRELHDADVNIPKAMRLVRIHIEQKREDAFVPVFSFAGVTPSLGHLKQKQPIPLLLCHPPKLLLNPWMNRCEQNFYAALGADSTSPVEVARVIARFQNTWAITMPFRRGSAALGEWLAASLYEAHGLTAQASSEALSVDHASFIHWGWENFYEFYMKNHRIQSSDGQDASDKAVEIAHE